MGSCCERREYSQRSQIQILPPLRRTDPDPRVRRGRGPLVLNRGPQTVHTCQGADRNQRESDAAQARTDLAECRDMNGSGTNASGSNPTWSATNEQGRLGRDAVADPRQQLRSWHGRASGFESSFLDITDVAHPTTILTFRASDDELLALTHSGRRSTSRRRRQTPTSPVGRAATRRRLPRATTRRRRSERSIFGACRNAGPTGSVDFERT
jgi:hypothetical protein